MLLLSYLFNLSSPTRPSILLCSNLPSINAFLNQSLSKPLLARSLPKHSFSQRFSQPVAFETLTRTRFAQTFPQPTLFSTTPFRNPYSHDLCPNILSANAFSTNRFRNLYSHKPSLNQRFSQPVPLETLTRTIFAQTFFRPTLFSTSRFRNPYSHELCSNLPSTTAFLNQSLSKPFLARSLLRALLNHRFSKQPLLKQILRRGAPRQRLSAEAPTPQRSSAPALRRPRPSAEAPTPQR